MIKPLNDKVLVKLIAEPKEVGEYEILDQARPQKGTVVEVNKNSPLAKGDTVFFAKHVGYTINIEGNDYLVLADKDIDLSI